MVSKILALVLFVILYHVNASFGYERVTLNVARGTLKFHKHSSPAGGIPIVHKSSLQGFPKETKKQLLEADAARMQAIVMAIAGNATMSRAKTPVTSGYSHGVGDYFVRMAVGRPAKSMYLVMDTGSDLPWIQCASCTNCYSQVDPKYDPKASTTSSTYSCTSPKCNQLNVKKCGTHNVCRYGVQYGDGSFTVGDLVKDMIDGEITTFGCGQNNQGLFKAAAGIVGLGGGKLSLVSQRSKGSRKFSYCLVHNENAGDSSSLVLGEDAISSDVPYVFTQLITNPKIDTFYYVRLLDISVGGERLGIPASTMDIDAATGTGGFIVDSGTTITYLPTVVYNLLRDAFRSGTSKLPKANSYSILDTCYNFSGLHSVRIPSVTLHFESVDIDLAPTGYMWRVDGSSTFCFAFAETSQSVAILGNIQQQTMRVAFDIDKQRIGFAGGQC